jgi:RimJ/RimL family protein N-acetyltransferase
MVPMLEVREMRPDEVHMRIDYFHGATGAYLAVLGVDQARLPAARDWEESYRLDHGRPLRQRNGYALVWELDGSVVGFSTADRIVFGVEAFMHLHLLEVGRRGHGLGSKFVRLSAQRYFDVLDLERLFSEPNAMNVAPNRALQRAGFRYVLSHECTPGPINFPQVTTRWVTERGAPPDGGGARDHVVPGGAPG